MERSSNVASGREAARRVGQGRAPGEGGTADLASTVLVVDLDGTLTATDTLVESFVQMVRHNPLDLLRTPARVLAGRAAFKAFVAARVRLDAAHLPYRVELLHYLRAERARGRRIYLATAAHRDIAHAVAGHLGLFDGVLATEGERNLKGAAKLAAIREALGDDFVYVGDSRADLPIWRSARGAVLVGAPAGLAERVRATTPVEQEIPKAGPGLLTWLRALRVHQWLKNLLIFVPLLTAFSFHHMDRLATALLAFLAFSLAASATYVVNDLWDLDSDRAHPRKRRRPFASAEIPIVTGVLVAGAGLAAALGLAAVVSAEFLLVLLIYLALTSAYSWLLKEYVLVDVLLLSLLYTLRILAGAVAVGVQASSWLLAFSVFIFFSLALVKRCSELVLLGDSGQAATRGRDYRTSDLVVLWPLGVGSALCAVVVFGLFISTPETEARYASPELLWLVAVGLVYWLARLWIKTARGEMHDDPIVFAVRDFGSRVTILAMLATTLSAHSIALV